MAHLLNFDKRNGTWSFASHSEKAWHGLGQVVQKAMTSEEAIKLANLDYEVAKTNVAFKTNDEYNEIDGFFATYRTDNNDYLGIVRSRYEIVQNREAFGFFDSIVDAGEAIFETAGALGKGEKIFVTAKLPDDIEVGGEKIEKYILLMNSHDGSSSIVAGMTNVRVVCNNTLQAALRGLDNKVSIDHRIGAKDRVKEAYKVMGLASKYSVEVSDYFNRMVDYKMDDGQFEKFIKDIFTPEFKTPMSSQEQKEMSTRFKNIVDQTMQFAQTHHTQTTDAAKGTLWGAYNSISGYYNYIKKFNSSEDKFSSQFLGTGNKKMLKSFQHAVALIDK